MSDTYDQISLLYWEGRIGFAILRWKSKDILKELKLGASSLFACRAMDLYISEPRFSPGPLEASLYWLTDGGSERKAFSNSALGQNLYKTGPALWEQTQMMRH